MPKKTVNDDLPPNVKRRTKGDWVGYYYCKQINWKRKEIPLGSSLEEAMAAYDLIKKEEAAATGKIHDWSEELSTLYARTKKRAKAKGLAFGFTFDDLIDIFESSGRACALSGIAFNAAKDVGQRFRPWMPSLDRIDHAGPYTKENVRLVCSYVNIAINQFGEHTLIYVARKIGNRMAKRGGVDETVSSTNLPVDEIAQKKPTKSKE